MQADDKTVSLSDLVNNQIPLYNTLVNKNFKMIPISVPGLRGFTVLRITLTETHISTVL